jgi:hypothetical protein
MSHQNGSKKHSDDSETWGLCKDCKWWQIEPGAKVTDRTVGVCIEDSLHDFRLRITGNGGCAMFTAGEPARATGSAERPPTTFAVR